MRLTIIAPDNVFEHDVDSSMQVQDIQALIEAEVSNRYLTFLPTGIISSLQFGQVHNADVIFSLGYQWLHRSSLPTPDHL
jgi:hypothetical protein